MRYIIGIVAFWLATTTWAVDRTLPGLTLADKDGLAVSQQTLQRVSPWVLLVVDANRPQTQATLMRLQRTDGDWLGSVAVVVVGNQAVFDALVAKNVGLTGVRWYRDVSGNLFKTLSLPGAPAALGISPDNQIRWRSVGLPEQVDKAQSLVWSWINTPAVAPAVK